ncbi:MAG: EamA family transporter [Bacteroidales bacterium]|nr:EamA family transporter [Bacteroidales bacterium]
MEKRKGLHWGYLAGIISGITYGMNPLFGVPVINKGLDVNSLLFYRYGVATLLMLAFMLVAKKQIRISWKQFGLMTILGILFTGCSITLFEAYKYIPSGIATSILYVYPIMVALIMMFFKQFPSWQTWVSIFAGVAGAVLLSMKGGGGFIDWKGIALVVASGLCYTIFIVMVNLSKQVKAIPNLTLTFYCFFIGSLMLFALSGFGVHLNPVPDAVSWLNVLGLAILPTAVATITLAASSKAVGATKTSVLGILEPLTAIVIGTLVFKEAFTLNVALGVVLILFAILFMILTEKKPSSNPKSFEL